MTTPTTAPEDNALAILPWDALVPVERVLVMCTNSHARRAIQDWMLDRLGVLKTDLPKLAQVRAGVMSVAGFPVVLLAYKRNPATPPRVWVTTVSEVTR